MKQKDKERNREIEGQREGNKKRERITQIRKMTMKQKDKDRNTHRGGQHGRGQYRSERRQ